MRRIILSAAFLFASIMAMAYNINGVIINTNTSAPLEDVAVLLYKNGVLRDSVMSSSTGRFSLNLNKNNVYSLEVKKEGYKTETAELNVTQEFVQAMPTLTVKLMPLGESILAVENTNNGEVEDIGLIDSLPEGYKIIEAIPVKTQVEEKSRFNVSTNQSNYEYTNVDVEVMKDEFNKENAPEEDFVEDLLPSSFYEEGEILYAEGKALLTEEIETMLINVASRLKAEPNTILKITGYADANREASIDDYISKMRVEEVTNYLMKQEVSFSQLKVIIIGNKYLENGCYENVHCDGSQHQANRRVALELVK
ncbi:MAG: OmpA family protein [Chitinophagales bacterium]